MAGKRSDATPAAPRAASSSQPGTDYRSTCTWETAGRRCGLPATIGSAAGGEFRGLCTWHYECTGDARSAQEEEAFRLWLERRDSCSLWRHYPAAYLWALSLGHQPHPVAPRRCAEKCTIQHGSVYLTHLHITG